MLRYIKTQRRAIRRRTRWDLGNCASQGEPASLLHHPDGWVAAGTPPIPTARLTYETAQWHDPLSEAT